MIVVHLEHLFWAQHPISQEVSFLYSSEEESSGAARWHSWELAKSGGMATGRMEAGEIPVLGKAWKPTQFNFFKTERRVIGRRPRWVYRKRAKS